MTKQDIDDWTNLANIYLSHEDKHIRNMMLLLLSYLQTEKPTDR